MDEKFFKMCGRKRQNSSKGAADRKLTALKRQHRGRARGVELQGVRAYECPYCSCWHLGHGTPARTQPAPVEV